MRTHNKTIVRLVSNTQFNHLASVRRWASNTTASSAESASDEVEWKQAKPYNEIPGHRPLPVIGSMCALLPLVGKITKIQIFSAPNFNYCNC